MKIVRFIGIVMTIMCAAITSCNAVPVTHKRVYESVAHVYASGSSFNWLEPFKTSPTSIEQGSGFVIDDEGHIITNFHVIKDATEINVTLPSCGQRMLHASVVGICPESDVALLKLTQRDCRSIRALTGYVPHLILGDSDNIEREQHITAYGYPFGQQRVNCQPGVVSGFEVVEGESFIEVTTPLSSGYSGGPCVDRAGRVVGINNAQLMGIRSMNFIIPINEIKKLLPSLRRHTVVHRPFFGISFVGTHPTLMRFLCNPDTITGLYVTRVYKHGACAAAGIVVGDVLCSLNGHALTPSGELKDPGRNELMPLLVALNQCSPDQIISCVVYRHGKKRDVTIDLGAAQQLPIRYWYPPFEHVDYEIVGGLVLMPFALNHLDALRSLDTNIAKRLSYYEEISHRTEPKVIVTHLGAHSPARDIGTIREGDIVQSINDMRIRTLADVRCALKKISAKKQKYIVIKTDDDAVIVFSRCMVCAST
jgi:S1-C subfamily serine protease